MIDDGKLITQEQINEAMGEGHRKSVMRMQGTPPPLDYKRSNKRD